MKKNLDKFSLDSRTALITGAAGLLGIEHASALLEVGATVVLTDVNKESLHNASVILANRYPVERIRIHLMDVSDIEHIRAVACQLRVCGIRIDILINNASVDPKVNGDQGIIEMGRLETFSLEQWGAQLDVGLTGAFLCSQIFGSAMAEDGGGGVILNIASDLSIISPDQRLYRIEGMPESRQPVKPVTYSVVKAGLLGLTRYLATYWAHKGVRSNALSPGGVFNGQGQEFVDRLTSLIPLGRMARHDEYQAAVQFLCSDASSYLNGQNIVMDGGRSTW